MASLCPLFLGLCLSSTLLISFCLTPTAAEDDRKVYIVYMGALPSENHYSPTSHHQNMLREVVGINSVQDSLIRSYGRSFNGFVAKLTEAEKEKLAGMKGVVSVFPSRELRIQTTRSWDFMGFGDKYKHNREVHSDTIVGVIDTGIWPESESFTDEGFGPPPKKWKGACKGGSNFTCNNKLIGARNYVTASSSDTSPSARDIVGHGTHTASIATGNKVNGVSFYGLAKGTARGGAPSARIAAYRVCYYDSCKNEDIMAAFDDAISDGVDVLSVSLGASYAVPFEQDAVAIGSFHAMEKGILTVNAGGNSRLLYLKTISSISPWLLSVAASTTDRKIVTKVVLGNGRTLLGRSINTLQLNGTKFALVFGKTALNSSSSCSEAQARACNISCLDGNLIKGNILVCDQRFDTLTAKQYVGAIGLPKSVHVSAIGLIFRGNRDNPDIYSAPVSVLPKSSFELLSSYLNSTENPEGTILTSETIKDKKAPVVLSFSSRGPNTILSDILKPDITAPGVSILSAYPSNIPVEYDEDDKRRVKYNFMSGTSMSCPHVTGIAAYIKTVHPDWSPSMIKSAIMTTARAMNPSSSKGAEFAYGSGHVNPTKAIDPGLVYETTRDDYIRMLCAMNYTSEKLRAITADNGTTCPQGSNKKMAIRDLNYPSMAVQVSSQSNSSDITFSRTVTNVGSPNSTYTAKVIAGPKLSIKVEPETLSFRSKGEKKSFKVTISGSKLADIKRMESASLVWSDSSHHIVRSPIVVYSDKMGYKTD